MKDIALTSKDNIKARLDEGKKYLQSENEDLCKDGFELLLELSDKDIAEAQFIVGRCFYEGIGTSKNLEFAEDYLQEAANNGYAEAKLLLGKLYAMSSSPLRQRKMLKLYKSAAEEGIPEGMYLYALQLLKSNEEDEAEAITLMQKAAKKNYPLAQTFIAVTEDTQGNFDNAYNYYKKAAKHNDTFALRLLADRYMYDDIPLDEKQKDEEQDYSGHIYKMHREALKFYKKAAKNGDLEAQFRCAIFERDGIYANRSPNTQKAIQELFFSAEKYYESALACLKKLAESGRWDKYFGIYGKRRLKWLEERLACADADDTFGTEAAYKLYTQLAPSNNYAKYKQALCLYFGNGVHKDVKFAVSILQNLTENKLTNYNPLAHCLLSYYYLCEKLPRLDNQVEIRECQKRALQSHRNALVNIANIFSDEKDFYKAIKEELNAEALVYKIAELANNDELFEDNPIEQDTNDKGFISLDHRKQELGEFLVGIKNKMNFDLVSSSAYAKYCSGERPLDDYDKLQNVALDARLTLEECKTLYQLAGRIFSPLTISNDYALKKVLSGDYKDHKISRAAIEDEQERMENAKEIKSDYIYTDTGELKAILNILARELTGKRLTPSGIK